MVLPMEGFLVLESMDVLLLFSLSSRADNEDLADEVVDDLRERGASREFRSAMAPSLLKSQDHESNVTAHHERRIRVEIGGKPELVRLHKQGIAFAWVPPTRGEILLAGSMNQYRDFFRAF